LTSLETALDAASATKPNPGRTESLRRLNRTEYQNAIRDLLALDIDAASLLPADESGHGFDNVTVGDLPATLLNRYIAAAQKISRLAVGNAPALQSGAFLQSDTIEVAADLTQEDQLPGMPIGTRGGVSASHTFPQDGEYDIQILLARNLEGVVSGLREARPHELLVLIDRGQVVDGLKGRGIGASVHFIPLHLHPYYVRRGFRAEDFPVATHEYPRVVSLPIWPGMSSGDVDRVVSALEGVLGSVRR